MYNTEDTYCKPQQHIEQVIKLSQQSAKSVQATTMGRCTV